MCEEKINFISDNAHDSNPYPINIRNIASALIENGVWFYSGKHKYTTKEIWLQNQSKKYQKEAVEWFSRKDGINEWGSFAWCCEILQIEASYIRGKLPHINIELRYRYR